MNSRLPAAAGGSRGAGVGRISFHHCSFIADESLHCQPLRYFGNTSPDEAQKTRDSMRAHTPI
jgi:hypothetical protein